MFNSQQLTDTGHMQTRQLGRPLLTASELMELKPNEVLIMTPTTPPLLCERFTYETFGVPPGFEPPARAEHQILADYVGGRKRSFDRIEEPAPAPAPATEPEHLRTSDVSIELEEEIDEATESLHDDPSNTTEEVAELVKNLDDEDEFYIP